VKGWADDFDALATCDAHRLSAWAAGCTTVDGQHAALADCSLDAYYQQSVDIGFDTSLVNVSKLLHYKRQRAELRSDGCDVHAFMSKVASPPADLTVGCVHALLSTNAAPNTLVVDAGATAHVLSDSACLVHPSAHRSISIAIRTGNSTSYSKSIGPATFLVSDVNGRTVAVT